MKFIAFFIVVLMCFPCIVEVTPEPHPLISLNISPSVIATTFTLLECIIIELAIAYIGVCCKVLAIGNAVSTIVACVAAALPFSLGNLFLITFNSLATGFEEVGVPCYDTLSLLSSYVKKKCLALFSPLNTLFVQFGKEGILSYL